MTKHISRLKIKCVSNVEKRDIKGKKRKEKKSHYAKKKKKKKYNQNGTQRFEYTKGVLRRTDNTMTNEKDKKRTYGQQILHKQLKIEKNEPH